MYCAGWTSRTANNTNVYLVKSFSLLTLIATQLPFQKQLLLPVPCAFFLNLNLSTWLMPISRACRAEKGRGVEAQLCLENSSPDIYDYDGPSLVVLLWNINKLNRLQIIMTTEFKPQTVVQANGCLSLFPA